MGIFDKLGDIAEKAARPTQGILTGYISEKINNTRLADEQNAKFIEVATNQYFNEDRPNFIKQEDERYNNFLKIKRDKGLSFAQFADSKEGGFATTNAQQTEIFLKRVADLKPEQIQDIETSFTERRKKRAKSFDEKNAFIRKQFQTMPGGPGDMNVMSVFFPNEGEDIAEVGVNQLSKMDTEMQPTVDQTGGLLDINNVSGVYDLNKTEHRQLERIAANQFNQLFFDKNTQRFNFTISGDKKGGEFIDSRYPTVQLLKKGYSDAVKQGYEFGFEVYARDKFVQLVMDSRGIKGYQGTLPPEKIETKAEETKTEIKAAPGDGQKFDAPDVSKIGVKEGVNEKSRQVIDGKVVSYTDASDSINKLREAISKISNSNILSDDQKEKNIDIARERTRQKIIEMGLDPDKFSF